MPPTLRKRKAPATEPAAASPAKKRGPPPGRKAAAKPTGTSGTGTSTIAVGSTIDLNGFGGVVETHDGRMVTLQSLAAGSKQGVILFTYPKASTPGCTKQVRNFTKIVFDATCAGFLIYGLSRDSTKANTTFHNKNTLPYPLLCDPNGTLISAIGLKKEPSRTTRGVFMIENSGKVLLAQEGSPDSTVNAAKRVLNGRKLYPFSEFIQVRPLMPRKPDGTFYASVQEFMDVWARSEPPS